ncbi:hypothetical protein FO519_002529 [Halicephalobus sp. NKZ332]|nr:hypothetical protein FO519_002529 [Halicephalobus sp. NKZ332]
MNVNFPRNPLADERPQNYTCCGRLHIQTAAAFCVVFTLFMQFLQIIVNGVHDDRFTNLSESISTTFDAIEFTIVALVAYSIYKKSEQFLLPALAFSFFFVCALTIHCVLYLVSMINDGEYSNINGHQSLIIFILFVYFTLYQIWFTSIMLALYNYFRVKRRRVMNILSPHVIVNPNYEE